MSISNRTFAFMSVLCVECRSIGEVLPLVDERFTNYFVPRQHNYVAVKSEAQVSNLAVFIR